MAITTINDPETYTIIGAGMEVHKQLGCGFGEAPYSEALSLEFCRRGIPFQNEVKFGLVYKGTLLKSCFRADFVCYRNIIVELKALRTITGIEESQVLNYLKASGMKKAVLMNFGRTSIQVRRFLNQSIILSV